MSKQPKNRHFFPAGNTTRGFYSFFDHILHHEAANHIYSFKGGPGTGKSSMMRKISEHYEEKGLHIEYHHCSSDPDSLDAIVIPEAKVAFMDGTAPHIVDPKTPGAIDEIINLGDNWDRNILESKRDTILKARQENTRLFQKAYGYLRAAGALYHVYEATASSAFNRSQALVWVNELIQKLFREYPIRPNFGKRRSLFAFGITPKGIINYREDYLEGMETTVRIIESVLTSSKEIMDVLADAFIHRGFDVICLHSPINPDAIVEIICDELNILVSVDNRYYPTNSEVRYIYEVDLTEYIDHTKANHIQKEIDEDIYECDRMLEKAIQYIEKAKENHDQLEKYYVDALDFSKHDELAQKLIKEIDRYLAC